MDGEPGPRPSAPDLAPVYDRLRAIAARHMAGAQGHTLQPTAIVHEAWLRLAQADGTYADREHFLAVAARAMRQILIDHARRRGAQKRGGGVRALTLDEQLAPGRDEAARVVDLLALDEALVALAGLEPRHAAQVELRFFGGLTTPETARVLGVSTSTAEKDWAMARAWLFRRLGGAA